MCKTGDSLFFSKNAKSTFQYLALAKISFNSAIKLNNVK